MPSSAFHPSWLNEQLAQRFETHDPDPAALLDASALRSLRHLYRERNEIDEIVARAIKESADAGHSWNAIGAMLDVSGETIRLRFDEVVET